MHPEEAELPSPPAEGPPDGVTFLPAPGSLMEPLIRAHDWTSGALGPFSAWPKTLQGYISMILGLPAPAIIFWGEDQIQIYNDGYADIMGPRRHPKYLGAPYRLCWPDTYPTIYPWMRRVLDKGEVVEVNRAHIPVTRHGFEEEAYFTFTFSPLHDDEGRITGILQIVTEVTEAALADSRLATLRALDSAATSPIQAIDQLGEVLAHNEQNIPYWLLFLRQKEERGLHLVHIGRPEAPAYQQLGREAASRAAKIAYESRNVVCATGVGQTESPPTPRLKPLGGALALPLREPGKAQPRGVLVMGTSPHLAYDGKYDHFVRSIARGAAILLASEEAAQAEEERQARVAEQLRLQQSERRARRELQLALRSGKMATWYVDLTTLKATISAEVARIFGVPYVENENVAAVIDRVIHPDDREDANRILEEAIRTRTFYSHEYRVLWPNGLERWVLSQGDKVADDGEGPAYAGVILDITERKLAEEEVKIALRARDEFLSIASHELNTPLTSLKLQAQMALRAITHGDLRVLAGERMERFIRHTDRQTDRLARLVDDMLDISRIRNGKLAMRPEHLSLSELTTEVIDRLRPAMAASQTPTTFISEARAEGYWDRLRMEQVVTNLLTNAMRYGGKKPVVVELRCCGSLARLEVRDQGLGIDTGALELIFSRFERQVNANEVSGLGLGLYITRNIVSAHGGRIWAESAGLGRGATFVVELPTTERGGTV